MTNEQRLWRALCSRFRAQIPGDSDVSDAELQASLVSAFSAAHAAWPDICVPDEAFVDFLAERSSGQSLAPVAHAADLYLACACVLGHSRAMEAFCATYDPVMTRVLQRRGAGSSMLSDLKQDVVSKLLLAAEGSRPKLADYRGLGTLKSWVAAVTLTTLLMALRSQNRRREQPTLEIDPIVDPILNTDPELRGFTASYREAVAQSIVWALRQLSDREKVLLRLHLCQGLSIDRLGTMYQVNRATAARWLAAARASVLQQTRAELQRRLRVTDRECDSILNLVQGQVEVSVARYLSGAS